MKAIAQNVKTGTIEFQLKDGRTAFVYPRTGYVRIKSPAGYLWQANKRGEYLNDNGESITSEVLSKSQRLPKLLNFLSNFERKNCVV